jgi:hypothetical protein
MSEDQSGDGQTIFESQNVSWRPIPCRYRRRRRRPKDRVIMKCECGRICKEAAVGFMIYSYYARICLEIGVRKKSTENISYCNRDFSTNTKREC